MLFLAVTSGLDKIKAVPPAFWWKLAAAVVIIILIAVALQKVASMNKVVLAVILMIVFMVVGVNWVYERNEPAFLTPVIDKIAPFLPSKGAYGAKQEKLPGEGKTPPPPAPKKK